MSKSRRREGKRKQLPVGINAVRTTPYSIPTTDGSFKLLITSVKMMCSEVNFIHVQCFNSKYYLLFECLSIKAVHFTQQSHELHYSPDW